MNENLSIGSICWMADLGTWYDVQGRLNWVARYVKEVDSEEETLRFSQEIYNEQGELAEIHQKYPEDTGHQRVD